MKACVVSYSLTGNNEALAHSLAEELQARHVRITEEGRRTMGTIIGDMVFHRTPAVRFTLDEGEPYDLMVFVGPVWMGQLATPLRACLEGLRSRVGRYAFVSISGGADGPNPKLAGELKKRLGKDPVAVVDLHMAQLLPPEPRPRRKDTMAYRLGGDEVRNLTAAAVAALRETVEPKARIS